MARLLALGALMLAVVMLAVDITVLHLALPAIAADLAPTAAEQLWIIDGYSFVLAGCLLAMGALGDRVGRRRLLFVGAVAFGLASAAAAFAPTAGWLIALRCTQGAAGATLMPATLGLIKDLYPEPELRQRAIAAWVAMFAAGSAVGPVVGGMILHWMWWGGVFLINIPLVALLLLLGGGTLPHIPGQPGHPFDTVGAVSSLVGVLAVVYLFKETLLGELRWSLLAVALLAAAALGVCAYRVRVAPNPVVDRQLIQYAEFRIIVLINAVSMFLYLGVLLIVTQYLEAVVGMSPLIAGVALLPAMFATVLATWLTSVLLPRFGATRLLSAALAISAGGLVALSGVAWWPSAWLVVAAFLALGVGCGMIDPISNGIILAAAPEDKASSAAALSEVGYELGGSLGMAILGGVLGAVYGHKVQAQLGDVLDPETLTAASQSIGAASHLRADLHPTASQALAEGAAAAFTHGAAAAAVVALAITVACWWRLHRVLPVA